MEAPLRPDIPDKNPHITYTEIFGDVALDRARHQINAMSYEELVKLDREVLQPIEAKHCDDVKIVDIAKLVDERLSIMKHQHKVAMARKIASQLIWP